ncbi:MAG: hypothetical protein KAI70_04350 [Candidatus Omnitrophica bacterium]|nr:hypothetical protein [Candidatus Omnitrophota bacterium]
MKKERGKEPIVIPKNSRNKKNPSSSRKTVEIRRTHRHPGILAKTGYPGSNNNEKHNITFT